MVNIKKEEIIIVIMPNKSYGEDMTNLAGQLSKEYNKICYVSINKQCDIFSKNLLDKNIDTNKFIFIDITGKVRAAKQLENCIHISSIFAINELSIALHLTLEKGKFDILIFDSLSTMLIYHDSTTIAKFVHNLIGKLRQVNCGAILTCTEADEQTSMVKDLGMLVDRIVSLSEEKVKSFFDAKTK